MDTQETEERKSKLPRFAYVGLFLLALAWLGWDPGAIETKLPEVTQVTYEELEDLMATSDELLHTGRYFVEDRTGTYGIKSEWLIYVYAYSSVSHDLVRLYAQGAQLYYEDNGMTEAEYLSILSSVENRSNEWATELRAETPPQRWKTQHEVFTEAIELIEAAAQQNTTCVHNGDIECRSATWRMEDAFEKFGLVDGLLEWELRFEFEVQP